MKKVMELIRGWWSDRRALMMRVLRSPWLHYSVLELLVMGPLLWPGYILALDMVFTPKIAAPIGMSNDWLWRELLHVINFVVPGELLEKRLIFLIATVAGVGMHRLIVKSDPKKNFTIGAYFAGFFYIVNPFTYERWLAGHYLLLAGYALMPWLIVSLRRWLAQPDWKQTGIVVAWYVAIGLVSLHVLALAGIMGVAWGVVELSRKGVKAGQHRQIVVAGLSGIVTWVIVNSYWLYGLIIGSSSTAQTIARFDARHLEAFTTAAHPVFGIIPNVLGLYGFWLERFNRFILPWSSSAVWLVMVLGLMTLVWYGARLAWRKQKTESLGYIVLTMIGLIMASGIHAPIWGKVVGLILEHVPLIRGFREPQKFAMLLVLAYAYFGAWAVQALVDTAAKWRSSFGQFVPIVLVLAPLIYVPTMIFGFVGQLSPVEYPASWKEAQQIIAHDDGDYRVLFLPWHQYMSYDFVPRVVANPAPQFFGDKIIAGNNAEFGDVIRDEASPQSDYIEQELLTHAGDGMLGERLKKLNIKYIFLARGYDWERYTWLDTEPSLKKIRDEVGLSVYRYKE